MMEIHKFKLIIKSLLSKNVFVNVHILQELIMLLSLSIFVSTMSSLRSG